MKTVTLEELLEAGCHFGHQVTRQNPKARDYIFEAREGIHIIDLEKTKEGLDEASTFINNISSNPGSTILILAAKRQAHEVIKKLLSDEKFKDMEGVYTVTNRWIGGTFTNFEEVAKNYKKLKDTKALLNDSNEKSKFTKKELVLKKRELNKLEIFYGGVLEMTKLPDVIYIIDTHREYIAVAESRENRIPIVGITDTNADPFVVNHPIPANDDAVGSIELITSYILNAWKEGKIKAKKTEEALKKEQEATAEKEKKQKEAKVKEKASKKPKK